MGLMMIELLCCHEILEIIMVCSYFNWTHYSFQKVSLFLQYMDDCQYFLIMYFIVLFHQEQELVEKCN